MILLMTVIALLVGLSSLTATPATGYLQELYSLPARPKNSNNVLYEIGVWLLNLDVDPNTSGDQQVVYASPGETISVTAQYQVWTPPEVGSPGVIWQLFFIYSWTPDWPPPPGHYAPLYDGIPGRYPGVTETKTFQVTVPSTPGTYYLWFCMSQHYSMEQAIAEFTTPLTLPAHAKIVVQSEEVSCDIWVDKGEGATYCIDEPITICYSVSKPIWIQIWVITSEGARIILEGYDDGTGDCLYGTIGPPTGTHTYRIKAIEEGEIVCQDETWVWVEECGAEGEEIKFKGTTLRSLAPVISADGWVVQVEQVIFGPPISGEVPVWTYVAGGCDRGYADPNIEEGDTVEVYGMYYPEPMAGYPEQVRTCESDDYYIVKLQECATHKFRGEVLEREDALEATYGYGFVIQVTEVLAETPDYDISVGDQVIVWAEGDAIDWTPFLGVGDMVEVLGHASMVPCIPPWPWCDAQGIRVEEVCNEYRQCSILVATRPLW